MILMHGHPEYPSKVTMSILACGPCFEGQCEGSLIDASQVKVLGAQDCE